MQAAHPPPPISAIGVRDWRNDLDALRAGGRGPRIALILGDFNATLDDAKLRAVVGRGFVDAADATGDGLTATFPVGESLPPRLTIDHVLVDRRASARDTWAADVAHSDHRAILTTIALPRG